MDVHSTYVRIASSTLKDTHTHTHNKLSLTRSLLLPVVFVCHVVLFVPQINTFSVVTQLAQDKDLRAQIAQDLTVDRLAEAIEMQVSNAALNRSRPHRCGASARVACVFVCIAQAYRGLWFYELISYTMTDVAVPCSMLRLKIRLSLSK